MNPTFALLTLISLAHAGSWTIGNSGAPGTGRCASSCHGIGSGTVVVSGFPDVYQPDSLYLIQISSGGEPIKNFNASCRVGESVNPAGVLLGSSTTTIYSVPEEINGVQANALDLNSAGFYWLAPSEGIGYVRLFVSAHQGGYNGSNTEIVRLAEDPQAAPEYDTMPVDFRVHPLFPNPFNAATTISFDVRSPRQTEVIVYDVQGRIVETLFHGIALGGTNSIAWNPQTASGFYFISISSEGKQITQKALFAK